MTHPHDNIRVPHNTASLHCGASVSAAYCPVSAGDGITEERKCHSSAEMKYGMPRIRSRRKRIKESLGTKDKRQAQELHDKRKAELWRVEKLGDLPDVTFEEACLRWLEEKLIKNLSIQIKAGLSSGLNILRV